ncbi:MAG: LPS export ABC transporter ATP-binding protein [Candidatus Binatus sp.]|uniref:LPS export ABC transporter ATP-binding protein n=1 Tax=Candidatus Binatus sp. TaxID=2811406 RepID=UPI00271E949A|nr:LPS export ABC transporter ATP-binding protein [Candidatus Binatus sp.]MDO8434235.1 LPS export ABC transporter ATP-binding protein [Candidatus Binatus sp.]
MTESANNGGAPAPSLALRGLGLTKVYGGRAVVDHVDVTVKPGEVVGFLGPNGAGKTTTFYMLVGLLKPDSGRIVFGDEDITRLPLYQRARRGISYLPQEPSVFRKLTVEQNLLAVLETLPLSEEERHARLQSLLDELGIAKLAKAKAGVLSGGERRRVEITRALVLDPTYLCLDEPFAGIDPITVVEIQRVVSYLKERGIGVLMSDHNVQATLSIIDRAYIIHAGKILFEGKPREIVASDQVRQVFLGERFEMR